MMTLNVINIMEIYHVLNRGVDKRIIFSEDSDYFRFIHDLYEFNDKNWVTHNLYKFEKNDDIESRHIERELLVDVYAFCLMPNHYHLVLSPLQDDALPTYMRKNNMGYSKYFNIKYDRSGTLFQGRYKSCLIDSESYFAHIIVYVHLNPLDLKFPEWRKRPFNNKEIKEALKFLETYRWSSHLDYLDMKNFPSVTSRKYFLDYFGGTRGYEEALVNWLKAPKFTSIKDYVLEK